MEAMETAHMTTPQMSQTPSEWVATEIKGHVGFITLQRPQALNALNLDMVRALTAVLLDWRSDANIAAVAIRGSHKAGNQVGNFGGFCAGGDIRFFHQAALAGSPALEDFFTEEYTLNHLIHSYPKPYIAFMDGIVMGGGMGISQGASHRLVTGNTKMAMPETNIGLFPDVGGGYFLSRCPGRAGEWLALTGEVINASTAIAVGLADHVLDAAALPAAWDALAACDMRGQGSAHAAVDQCLAPFIQRDVPAVALEPGVNRYFALSSVSEIVAALEADSSAWAQHTAATLHKRSPLMLHVVLQQIRRARSLSLADDLRMERDLVRHCFVPQHLGRLATQSETVEGIRALAVDKDHAPHWNPARMEDVTPAMVEPFFVSPWPSHAHPLAAL